jgi:hypothetical protein
MTLSSGMLPHGLGGIAICSFCSLIVRYMMFFVFGMLLGLLLSALLPSLALWLRG